MVLGERSSRAPNPIPDQPNRRWNRLVTAPASVNGWFTFASPRAEAIRRDPSPASGSEQVSGPGCAPSACGTDIELTRPAASKPTLTFHCRRPGRPTPWKTSDRSPTGTLHRKDHHLTRDHHLAA